MNDLVVIITFVATAAWKIWPFFVISIFLAVLINNLNLSNAIRRAFDNKIGMAIVAATVVGAFSPFCSCTVIPVIAGLMASGVPLAPIMSFWVASPTMDPEIFALTAGVLGMPLAVVRLGSTLLLSLGAGFLTWALLKTPLFAGDHILNTAVVAETCCEPKPEPDLVLISQPSLAFSSDAIQLNLAVAAPAATCSSGSCSIPGGRHVNRNDWRTQILQSFQAIHWSAFGREMAEQSWSIGRWLLLAFLLEALITLYVPQTAIADFLGDLNALAVPLAALVGMPLYLSNISALPIVSGLLAQGMQPGAAIAFLIAGPITTVPAMTAVWGIVNRRIFFLYLAIGLLGAMLLGYLVNAII
ncbi:MAG: hypothetical protein GY759_14745 [Chloroflexi bacterium]|nr:hypothetical protein [Chloroflexota bacterium]